MAQLTAEELQEVRSIAELMQSLTLEMGEKTVQIRELDTYKAKLKSELDDTYITYVSVLAKNAEIASKLQTKYGANCEIELETGKIK